MLQVAFKLGAPHELGIKHQHPAVIHLQVAVIWLASYLPWRVGKERTVGNLVSPHAVREIVGEIVLHENAVNAKTIQRVPDRTHLVIVNDINVRMIDGSTDVVGVIIDMIQLQELFHNRHKITIFPVFIISSCNIIYE